MNCAEVETTLIGLARGEGVSPLAEKRALSHVRTCSACDRRLATEQQLNARLEALRVEMQADAAPPQVEAALLAKFNARTQKAVESPATRLSRPVTVRLLAAAAALLIAIAVLALVLISRPISDSPLEAQLPEVVPQEKVVQPDQSAVPAHQKDQTTLATGSKAVKVQKHSPKRPRRSYYAVGSRQSPVNSSNGEIVTEFLPVAGFTDPRDVEEGQILRVELPRSALLSFGLPMNPERAGERVRADVLVGSDGLARAIRFVGGNFDNGR